MPPAARVGDSTSHLATALTPGPPTGMVGPPAGAALPPVPGQRNPTLGVPSVRIGGMPAAVVGTICVCRTPPQHLALAAANRILPSIPSPRGIVLIGGFPAARQGDKITCDSRISTGALTVRIGG
jgi:uncharacterized Zn-binding protein involved in type VI secretion